MNIINEEWRDAVGYEGFYQVSNFGNVRSCDRYVKCMNEGVALLKGKARKICLSIDGYPRVTTRQSGKGRTETVHTLVAKAFLGDRPVGYHVNHLDGNKQNNFVGNLEYCTQSENQIHAYRLGLKKGLKGESSSRAKLKACDIPEIRNRLAKGQSTSSIAKEYKVSQSTIYFIHTKRSWSHIKP